MNSVGYFVWLARSSLEVGVVLLPHVALLALLGTIIAIAAFAQRPEATEKKWRWLLLPFLIPVIILIYGVAFRHPGPGFSPETTTRILVLQVLLWSHLPIAIILTILVRRNPLVPLGLAFLQFWVSLSTSAMAAMSVTGNWL